MSVTCSCATALGGVSNNPCDAVGYGNQIVKIFVQKMTGADFDGTTGNDVTVEADWDTRLAASDADKIVALPSLSNAVRESADPNVEDGNAVPYGGSEIIDRPQNITFDLKYYAAATFAAVDQIQCWPKTRIWFLDNNDYVWGADVTAGSGVADVSFVMKNMSQAGIGTKNRSEGNTASWNDLCEPQPLGQFTFLKTKE